MSLENNNSLTPKKASFNIPMFIDSISPLKQSDLTPTELKVYLQLSIEFQIVLDEAPSFQMGAYEWNQMLPDRLQKYGLTEEEWERISNIGDMNEQIQDQLNEIIEKLENSD